ncbi:MAG TPA: GNAT family N-acetyltransferase [Anaerolineae bacterium]|nr:GNAT family N-acetyltransferase [Anaerolineae bacterium]
MTIIIEKFDHSDEHYAAIERIANTIYPEYPETMADMQRRDRKREAKYHFQRFVGRESGSQRIIAYGEARHDSYSHHPQKFWVEVYLLPEQQGQGFGRKFYAHILDHLAPFNPTILEAGTRSDKVRAMRFLEDRGYELKTREYSSMLDLNRFDSAEFASYTTRCRAAGIEIIDLVELKRRYPSQWTRIVYDITTAVIKDIPWHDTFTPLPFDVWCNKYETQPNRIDGAFLLAMDGAVAVGVTMLFKSDATQDSLFTGTTGIRRAYRRKGIAIALKCQSLDYAKHNFRNAAGNAPNVMTENEENNPMYTINQRLGFIRQPDWMAYRKEMGAGSKGKGE